MIEYVKGKIDDLTPTTATIDCNGVGYLCNISLNTYSALQGKEDGKLYVYEAIREDAWVLFGFASKKERELFLHLISVSGVGGNTARTMLSTFSAAELATLILDGNDKMLKTVKGLGLKTAQKIIVELKDKVAGLALGSEGASTNGTLSAAPAINSEVYNEACEALKMLGFPPAPVAKAVKAILKDEPDLKVEVVIKKALKML
ncbi:MAG: Holliday junction branch migration protein RuvA [Prevotellaceae bacterium]|nr:Holliday junction branch migration protein RuvA [Candidatus Minthosoma caballi]